MPISSLFIVLGLSLGIAASPSALAEIKEGAPLYLEQGEQRILPFKHLERYSLSGSDVVHYVRVSGGDSILIKALRPGLATLYVSTSKEDSETHLIRVTDKKNNLYPPSLLQALNWVKNLEVIDGGDRYLLRGLITTPADARAVSNLKERFATFILDETTRPPSELERSIRNLKALLSGYPGVSFETKTGVLTVHGGVPSLAQKESLTRQIRAIDPLVSVELQTLSTSDPTLYFKVYLLEVKKELITSLGLQWPASQPASISLNPAQFLAGDSIDLMINALIQKNLARVLSSPELVVKAPGQAELFAGEELPIHERSRYNDNVVWKNVGLSLKLDVKEFGGEKVRLVVETEMSHKEAVQSQDETPTIKTNRIKTLVDGTLGKPLLLSGLLQEDVRTTASGIPGLSEIPILGALFGSEDYQNSRSEFVAILLPQRNLPAHPMERISSDYPKGYLPVPRTYVTEETKERVKSSSQYPWNAL